MPKVGRGQMLMPWPNRIRDGRYSFGDRDLQLRLSEAARGNASHGLVRWAAWSLEELSPASVSLTYRLMAQSGYPWTARPARALRPVGRRADRDADGDQPVPVAGAVRSGAHPYLRVGDGPRRRLGADAARRRPGC